MGGHALEPHGVARQLARGVPMQLRPLGRRDRVVQRLLDDRVHEPRRQSFEQEPGLDQRVHRVSRGPSVDLRNARRLRQRGIVAEDRERLGHRGDRRRVSPQPGLHKSRHRGRAHCRDGLGVEPARPPRALPESGNELAHEQGVPARRAGAFEADLVAGLLAEAVPHELRDRWVAERLRPQSRQRFALDQSGQGVRRGRGLARSHREDHAGGDLVDPRLQVGEEPKRVLVGPVRVVDKQGERPLLSEPRAEPMQAVKSREQATVGGGQVGHLLKQGARQPRGACKGSVTTTVRERLDARRQQLDHDSEGKLPLQRSAARAQSVHARAGCQLPGRSEQRALADPRGALDDHDRARASRGALECAADVLQLGLAL